MSDRSRSSPARRFSGSRLLLRPQLAVGVASTRAAASAARGPVPRPAVYPVLGQQRHRQPRQARSRRGPQMEVVAAGSPAGKAHTRRFAPGEAGRCRGARQPPARHSPSRSATAEHMAGRFGAPPASPRPATRSRPSVMSAATSAPPMARGPAQRRQLRSPIAIGPGSNRASRRDRGSAPAPAQPRPHIAARRLDTGVERLRPRCRSRCRAGQRPGR